MLCPSIAGGRQNYKSEPYIQWSIYGNELSRHCFPPSLARPCNFCLQLFNAQLLFLIKSCFLAAASARPPSSNDDRCASLLVGEGGQLIQQAFEAHGGHFAKRITSPSLWKIIRKCIAIPSKHGGLWSFVALTGYTMSRLVINANELHIYTYESRSVLHFGSYSNMICPLITEL